MIRVFESILTKIEKNDKNFKILLNKDSRYMQTNLHILKGAMYINSLGMGQVMGVF